MPEKIGHDADFAVSINEMLAMVTPKDEMLLAVDKETGIVRYSSDESYLNESVFGLGFSEASLQDG
ncbi:MAG: hypothetical protein Q4G41_07745, partial [Coriobacteriales bacterium]|nr:hypothetical protein [Coriobacteriales bacterium]